MEHEQQASGNTAVESVQQEINSQEIINGILELSLKPFLFGELLERVLDYLISQESLALDTRAAIFLINHDRKTLHLKASRGFSADQKRRCKIVKFGKCNCALAAQRGILLFNAELPPLYLDQDDCCQPHGHYAVPIIKDGQTAGVLGLYVTPGHHLSIAVEQLLASVANIIAIILESQKMDKQLIDLVNDLRISIISLREEKYFSESIIQSLNHGLIVADQGGNVIKSNSVARQTLKPFTETVEGLSLHDIFGEENARQLSTPSTTQRAKEEQELVLTTAAGEEKILRYSAVPRKDAMEAQVGVVISMTDITELKYVRKEMEKMNRLSTVAEIASAVAHEVRNPLAGIKIMAQSIEEEAQESGQQLECSRRIIRQVDRLNELLSEFFSYARPVIPHVQPVSLASILSEIRPLIKNRLMKCSINVVEKIPANLPPILADPNQMQQVFLNLMLNSIDAIKANGVIKITARNLKEKSLAATKKKYPGSVPDEPCIMVNFSDNGSGMPKDVADKVFEPFFTSKSTGTGLGLSIVYRTLRENDAAIVVESAPGKGTMFIMFFQAGQ